MLGEIVGAGGINDAAESEHDHFLVRAVVNPDYQNRGIGRQLVVALTNIAFLIPAVTFSVDGERRERERIKLDVAVIRYVEGWDRMPRILSGLGYRFVHFLPNQVTVKDGNTGLEIVRPTERYEISREDWFLRKDLREKTS
jgi:GNAT superfamily N-acetyltransferase